MKLLFRHERGPPRRPAWQREPLRDVRAGSCTSGQQRESKARRAGFPCQSLSGVSLQRDTFPLLSVQSWGWLHWERAASPQTSAGAQINLAGCI